MRPFSSSRRAVDRYLDETTVDHDGAYFHYDAVTVRPKPIQQPIDIWLGGIAPSETLTRFTWTLGSP